MVHNAEGRYYSLIEQLFLEPILSIRHSFRFKGYISEQKSLFLWYFSSSVKDRL